MYVIKNLNKVGYSPRNVDSKTPYFHKDVLLKARWTYSSEEKIDGYWSTVNDAQSEMITTMTKIYKLLEKNNISLSIVVYPWPQQIEKDNEKSKHVQMWKMFCENKCTNFINLFPIFFKEKSNCWLWGCCERYDNNKKFRNWKKTFGIFCR